MKNKYTKTASIAFIRAHTTGRYLMQLRAAEPARLRGEQWGLFGGKIDESDASPTHALIREVGEETGLLIHGTQFPILLGQFTPRPEKLCYVFCVHVRNEFKPDLCSESAGHGWFRHNQIPRPRHYATDRAMAMLTNTRFGNRPAIPVHRVRASHG